MKCLPMSVFRPERRIQHHYLVLHPQELDRLRGEIDALRVSLEAERSARSEAEQRARELQQYIASNGSGSKTCQEGHCEAEDTCEVRRNSKRKATPRRFPSTAATAFEGLNEALYLAQDLISDARDNPKLADADVQDLLHQVSHTIASCIQHVADIEITVEDVDIHALFADKSKADACDGLQSSGLADFIENQFTHRRKLSMGHRSKTKLTGNKSTITTLTELPNMEASPALRTVADGYGNWGLDIFVLNEQGKHSALEVYGQFVLGPICPGAFQCSEELVHKFTRHVAALYYNNPYHNGIHAAQVLHLGTWLTQCLLLEQQSDMECVAFAIAAMCHDVKHIGRNNAFCVNTEHPMALRYNDCRVLENMHAATCFELLQSVAGVDMLGHLTREDRMNVRSQIIEYILATDMSEHFEMLSKFRVRMESPDFDLLTPADRTFVARMCIKAADIGHASLPWLLHQNWSARVAQEFYLQGDEERRLGLPVSALCDRAAVDDLGKSQKGFLHFVCLPLFEALAGCEACAELEAETSASGTREARIEGCCIAEIKANADRWLEDPRAVEEVKAMLEAGPT